MSFIKGNRLIYREVIELRNQNISELKHHIKQTILDKFAQANTLKPKISQDDIDEEQIIYDSGAKRLKNKAYFSLKTFSNNYYHLMDNIFRRCPKS